MKSLPALVFCVGLVLPAGALASEREDAIAAVPKDAWAKSIVELDANIAELKPVITPIEKTTQDGPETVITLSSDILFAFGKAEISDRAEAKIRSLVAKAPKGAAMKVHGHTDSVGGKAFNQKLSVDRAEAVAAIIAGARPDLDLDVQGFGMDKPVAANESGGEDDPDGRALNRRVEIRYGG